MLCSSFSSSSVSDKGRAVDVLDRDMLPMMMRKVRNVRCFLARRKSRWVFLGRTSAFVSKRPRPAPECV
jgi:hypothetical protein